MTLRVSDHAVLRYLERAGGFQIERLRAAIAARLADAAQAGARYILIDGVIFVVRDSVFGDGTLNVTTVLLPEEHRDRRHRLMRPEDDA